MIRDFAKFYKPHMKLFLIDLFCALLVAICNLVYPYMAQNIMSKYAPEAKVDIILWIGFGLLGIYILKAFLNFVVQYWGHKVGVLIQADMRNALFAKLQKLPISYYDNNKTGTILSRLINDLMDISEMAHHGPEDIFLSLITLIGAFIMMIITVDFSLAIVVFVTIPFIVAFAVYRRRKLSKASKAMRVETGLINASVENSISGVRVTKAYVNSDYEQRKFEYRSVQFQNARMKSYKQMGFFFSGMNFFTDFLYLLALLVGGIYLANGINGFSSPDYTAYILYITMLINPIRTLVNIFEQIQNGMTGYERFKEVMKECEEDENLEGLEFKGLNKQIEFKDVSFKYNNIEQQREVLSHMNFVIEKGKTTALVGPSGGGKTTICNLLPRFYIQESGEILFDDVDSSKFKLASLRKSIGIVSQDVFLFSGTIKENIIYGNLNATEEEMIDAAKKANIHDFIMTLEKGYDTDIGERGVRLSGGQKQRISIARAFLKNPEILILDEATSALDTITELLIQEAIARLSQGRTVLVVAHRLSTIKNADKIIVLDSTGILEQGTHEELLELNKNYASLYNAQFKLL